jgi:phage gp36-like protein
MELFPSEELPEVIGTACCSQFAVSREKVRERGVEQYERARRFLMETSLGSEISGRIFEYAWHSKIVPVFIRC